MAEDNKPATLPPSPRRHLRFRLTRNLVLDYKEPKGDKDAARYERYRGLRDFCQRFKNKLSRPRFVLEVAAFIVLAVYTGAALYQSCQLKRSTDAAKESADANVATVRAWLYPSDFDPPFPSEIHVGQRFPVKFKNGGRTPATEILITEEFKYWPRTDGHAMPDFDRCEAGSHYAAQPYKVGAIFPDHETDWVKFPITSLQATPEQLARLITLKEGLLIHICIQYQTVSGQLGLTEQCSVIYGADLKATAPCLRNALILQ